MEHYDLSGQATLSLENVETTDNLIATAIKTMPSSAVAGILPVVKTKGPTSQWVEPLYLADKVKFVSSPVTMFIEGNTRKRLSFTSNAVENLTHMYTPQSVVDTLQRWIAFFKNAQQREDIIGVLNSPEVQANAPQQTIDLTTNIEDKFELVQDAVVREIVAIKKDYQMGSNHFSVVAPYAAAYAIEGITRKTNFKVHTMFDDRLDKIYVFPTGDETASRAGLTLFEYADEWQRAIDSETGELVYWIYNRSSVVLNPCHKETPIVRSIQLVK